MTTFNPIARGSIVLTQFPYTDLSGSTARPALVVASRLIGNDIVVIGISSVIRGALVPTDCLVDLRHPEFPLTGLRVTSVIRAHKLAAIEQSLIKRRLGEIGPQLQTQVDLQLRQVLGL